MGRLLRQEHRAFNFRVQLVVENAFDILSAQWRMRWRPMQVHHKATEKCVRAMCVPHHFIQKTREVKLFHLYL